MSRFKKMFCLVSVSLILVACSFVNEPQEECRLPCWAGIEIEETSTRRTQRLINERYGSDNVEVREINEDRVGVSWTSNGVDQSQSGYVALVSDEVEHILIHFDPGAFTVADLLTQAGDPDLIYLHTEPEVAPRLLYTRSHMMVSVWLQNDTSIEPDTPIFSLLIDASIDEDWKGWTWRERDIQNWRGYSDYVIQDSGTP